LSLKELTDAILIKQLFPYNLSKKNFEYLENNQIFGDNIEEFQQTQRK
jgi:hypothetical protein